MVNELRGVAQRRATSVKTLRKKLGSSTENAAVFLRVPVTPRRPARHPVPCGNLDPLRYVEPPRYAGPLQYPGPLRHLDPSRTNRQSSRSTVYFDPLRDAGNLRGCHPKRHLRVLRRWRSSPTKGPSQPRHSESARTDESQPRIPIDRPSNRSRRPSWAEGHRLTMSGLSRPARPPPLAGRGRPARLVSRDAMSVG